MLNKKRLTLTNHSNPKSAKAAPTTGLKHQNQAQRKSAKDRLALFF
jgi:hypothetical protein